MCSAFFWVLMDNWVEFSQKLSYQPCDFIFTECHYPLIIATHEMTEIKDVVRIRIE